MRKSLVMIGAILMGIYGCASNFDYGVYACRDSEIGISSLSCINGWAAAESRGSNGSYAQVQFIEGKTPDTTAKGSMSFTSRSISADAPGAAYDTAGEILKKRSLLKGMNIISRSDADILGGKAVRLDISYEGLDKPHKQGAAALKMRERIIVLRKGAGVYVFNYINAFDAFDRYAKAFDHIVSSVRFNG